MEYFEQPVVKGTFLTKLLERLGGKCIYVDDQLYLTRYYLIGDGSGNTMEVYLHKLSDIDKFRWLHNHPWTWFLSIVLSGSYVQERLNTNQNKIRSHRVRWFNLFRGQGSYHAIRELPSGAAWTLVVVPPKTNHRWGYWNSETLSHLPDDDQHNATSKTVLFRNGKQLDINA